MHGIDCAETKHGRRRHNADWGALEGRGLVLATALGARLPARGTGPVFVDEVALEAK